MAFTRRGFFIVFRGPRWLGYEHVLLFLPAQSVVSFFLCLGHTVIDSFSLSVTTKYPALFRIRSTSSTFLSSVRCCRELTPRLSKCAEMSSLHANRGTICDPVPSKLQAESGELNEQVTFMLPTAKSAEMDQCQWMNWLCLQIIRLIIVPWTVLLTNIRTAQYFKEFDKMLP